MASGFFAVLDDIAVLMDDVAVASKLATKKTAGILGDDLAVNAEKATGFSPSRELPVLWAITKGSFVNKIIILPVIFLLNYFFPEIVKYVLIAGGLYLAYEGVEKILWYLFHRKKEKENPENVITEQPKITVTTEKDKIKSAIITDFILSVEIIIIALSTVADADLTIQIITVSVVAILATVGVYGLVALIVRMDDFGQKLVEKSNNKGFFAKTGNALIQLLPWVIKSLTVIGTIALLLVSGEIFSHHVGYFHDLLTQFPAIIRQVIFALVTGTTVFFVVSISKKIFRKSDK